MDEGSRVGTDALSKREPSVSRAERTLHDLDADWIVELAGFDASRAKAASERTVGERVHLHRRRRLMRGGVSVDLGVRVGLDVG